MNQLAFLDDVAANRVRLANIRHIAIIGNAVPRRCGLATFTADCFLALQSADPGIRIDYYAMDDGSGVEYASDIHLIRQDDPLSYSEAALAIEQSGAEAIWLQHEFGIFGGSAGELIVGLLQRTRLPLLTTLHTVLETPDVDQRRVFDAVVARSQRLMVMAEKARDILSDVYGIDTSKVSVIPHGVPDRPYVDPATMKARFGFEGRDVILTFGLLAPDKGIDRVIQAMPDIVAAHPRALYVVLGATHPHIVRQSGESVREGLRQQAADLGVADHVAFIDRFVELDELCDYLQAADVYVTPYNNPAQITSGTLSYAVAMGKPVVSTPYIHATEILRDDHGILVPFGDSAAMAAAIDGLLSDDEARANFAARAYARGRGMIWEEIGRAVLVELAAAREDHPTRLPARRSHALLKPDLAAILRMSDATGMLQHAIFSVPDRNHGYCLDDNCRALMLMHQMPDIDPELADQWTTTYAAFVQHAWNPDIGRFRNFMRFDRSWCESEGSEDSCGRALWSLGVTVRDGLFAKHRDWASQLFDTAISGMATLEAPRAQAFAMLGAAAIIDARPGHAAARSLLEDFGTHLMALVDEARRPDWAWFETVLAYDNARLPQALIVAGRALDRDDFIRCGLETLAWIVAQQTAPEGHFRPVGSESFGRPYAAPLPFDQQPLEAQATIEAAAVALGVDPDGPWLSIAENAYRWYLGQNDLAMPLADKAHAACFDGLTPVGVNRNQGAESLLALQFSSCVMKRLSQADQNMPRPVRVTVEALPA